MVLDGNKENRVHSKAYFSLNAFSKCMKYPLLFLNRTRTSCIVDSFILGLSCRILFIINEIIHENIFLSANCYFSFKELRDLTIVNVSLARLGL